MLLLVDQLVLSLTLTTSLINYVQQEWRNKVTPITTVPRSETVVTTKGRLILHELRMVKGLEKSSAQKYLE